MAKALTPEEFLERSRGVWGSRWDYSCTKFLGTSQKIEVICPEHGPYTQRASSHLGGELACPECRGVISHTRSFIFQAKKVWGDRWDYSKTSYTNSRTKLTIICPEHGTFQQTSPYHLEGRVGCKSCNGQELTQEEFRTRSDVLWKGKWDLTHTRYVNWATPLRVRCPKHGIFTQSPAAFFSRKVGCEECRGTVSNLEQFIERSKAIFGEERWDYSKTIYSGSKAKLTITCPKHDRDFIQVPTSHLRGAIGCSSCSAIQCSKGESEVADFMRSLGVDVQTNVRGLLETNLELDVYLPHHKLAVEYNGLYFHSDRFLDPKYHYRKFMECSRKGIRLIQIWEDQWIEKRDIVEETLKRLVHKSTQPKVYARQTQIVSLTYQEAKTFLDAYHIQGSATGTLYVGLQYRAALVAVAVLKVCGNAMELVRYATSVTLPGGHSKIVAYLERSFNYSHLYTFADQMISVGNLYLTTGWTQDKVLAPDYFYVSDNRRYHKFNYRKSRFKANPRLRYVEGMTERELALMNGLYRVYDAGKVRFIKPHPTDTIENGNERQG